MVFELQESLRTGIAHLDDDHENLISRINALSAVEQSADTTAVIDALLAFKAELEAHFHSEEANLKAANYPKLAAHAKHHAETIIALERLIDDVRDGAPIEGGAAYICFHELISVVLLRDMQFINWRADQLLRQR